jgi:sugar phosphate isomerase/epimerase
MEIGVLVRFNDPALLDDQFANLRKNDFSSCQLCSWEPALWTKENADLIRLLTEKYGIRISAFWCGWEGPKEWNFYDGPLTLGLVPVEYRAMRVKNLCDGADFAHLLGVTDVVTHMGFIPEDPNDPLFAGFCIAVRTVARHLQKNGQYLLFETGQETPAAMLRCFEKVGTDNLGVNLDTANLILYGKANPVDSLDVFGSFVRNLHAKDGLYPTDGMHLGKEVAIGQGKVDFAALFRRLRELGYDGDITIEREIKGEKQLEDILASREYMNKLLENI